MPHIYSMKFFVTSLVLGLFCINPAFAEQELATPRVDRVFGLNPIEDLSIGSADNRLVVTFSNRVLQFSSFPLKVTADISLDDEPKIVGINSNVTSNQTLVILGKNTQSGQSAGTLRIYRDIGRSLEGKLRPGDAPLRISPFSQALLKGDDDIFAVNPTWNTVIRASISELLSSIDKVDKDDSQVSVVFLDDLFLKCGRAGFISVFEHQEKPYYVTSVSDSKLIELGPLEYNKKLVDNVDCFDPVISLQENSAQLGTQPFLHGLIDNPYAADDTREVEKMLLTFDPESGQVSVFPMRDIRENITILRSAHYGLNLAENSQAARRSLGEVGLMASDTKGSVILISYQGSNVVHRLQSDDETLIYLGRFDLKKPVHELEISDDGKLAAIATSDGLEDGLFEIILIDNPGALAPNEQLSDKLYSVQNIQQSLGSEGFNLSTDGVYGPQTIGAISQFLSDEGEPALGGISAQPIREVTRGLTITKPTVQETKTEIGKALRGLFPLN